MKQFPHIHHNESLPLTLDKIHPLTSIEKEEFVSKFAHIQEDLKYMFQIDVESESQLHSEDTKQKIYTKAINDIHEGNPFSLEHFFEYGLISPSDIKKDDLPHLKTSAHKILYAHRSTARLTASKNLFIKMGILTEEDVGEVGGK